MDQGSHLGPFWARKSPGRKGSLLLLCRCSDGLPLFVRKDLHAAIKLLLGLGGCADDGRLQLQAGLGAVSHSGRSSVCSNFAKPSGCAKGSSGSSSKTLER